MSTYISRILKNAVFNPVDKSKLGYKNTSKSSTSDLIIDASRDLVRIAQLKLTEEAKMDEPMEVCEDDEDGGCSIERELPRSLQYLGLVSRDDKSKSKNETKNFHEYSYNAQDDHNFAKPQIYDCGYCNASFFNLKVYVKHIRRHKDIIRCKSCNKPYDNNFSKRTHEARCCRKLY